MDDAPVVRAAVVGGGTMGTGFAQVLALAGIRCAIADADERLAQASRERALTSAQGFERAGLMPEGATDRIAAGVEAASVAAACAGAEVVLEAVPEEQAVKAAVYVEVERSAPESCVVASNTSSIPIRELAASLARPERFLGVHWFNPPQWIPCVEVIRGPRTEEDVVRRVHDLLRRLGKQPVDVGDSAGFVANRIQFAMFREALAVVEEGVASPQEVDEVVRSSFGFRLPFFGPFLIADMAGLDVYEGVFASLAAAFGDRLAAPASLVERVREGRLGTKAGGGFLDVPAERLPQLLARRDALYVALAGLVAETGAWDQP